MLLEIELKNRGDASKPGRVIQVKTKKNYFSVTKILKHPTIVHLYMKFKKIRKFQSFIKQKEL